MTSPKPTPLQRLDTPAEAVARLREAEESMSGAFILFAAGVMALIMNTLFLVQIALGANLVRSAIIGLGVGALFIVMALLIRHAAKEQRREILGVKKPHE